MAWEKVKLGDVAETNLGKMLDQHKNRGDFHPYLANVNVRWGSFDLENLPLMKFESDELDRFGLRYGDLIVCEGGEPGRCAIWKENLPGIKFQKALHRVRVKDCMDYRYVFYWFLYAGKRHALDQYFTGSTIKHMPADKLRQVVVDYPPLKIQKIIGEVLSAYDNLIENNQKQIKLLEEAAQRLYKEWFIDLRFPGHETTKIQNDLPAGWSRNRADSFFAITIGKTPPRAESQWFTDGTAGYPWLSIADMGSGCAFVLETSEGLTAEAIKRHNVKVVPENTVLLSFKLTVGRVGISATEICTNEAIAHFVTKNEILREYTYCYLKNFHYDELGSTSSISKAINSKIIKGMPFVMPEDNLLEQFHKELKPYFDEMLIKQKQIRNLKEARDRLLPKLMSGEIEV